MSRESKIMAGIVVGIVTVMVGFFILANQGGTPTAVGDKKVIRDNSHKLGSGPIQLVEFGDYQCPACGAAYPVVKQLMKDYDGKITLYFRNFPLTTIHKNAAAGAQAAEAAGAQGKYWEMHDKLYESQQDWSEEASPTDKFAGYAKDLGLDVGKFTQAIQNNQNASIVDQDTADATALNVQATPTFFFNGTQYTGKSDYSSMKAQVDSLLQPK